MVRRSAGWVGCFLERMREGRKERDREMICLDGY